MQAAHNHRHSNHRHTYNHRDSASSHPAMTRRRLFLVREAAPDYRVEAEPSPTLAAGVDPSPDPSADPDDALFELGERCATAYMQADALQYRAMVLLAEFHHRQGWKNTHGSSTDEWLAWRLGIHRHTAQERLRTALALEHLPLTSRAMEKGELSFSKVRALTRAGTPENEAVLLEHAGAGSAANLDRFIRGWKLLDRRSEVTAEQIRHERRRFSAFVDADGMVVVRGRLDPEVGGMLMRAMEAATDALYRGQGPPAEISGRALEGASMAAADAELGAPTPAQRRADAVGLLALAAGFGGPGSGGVEEAEADVPAELLPAGSRESPGSVPVPLSGTRAERYMVMLHVDEDTLCEHGEPGLSELHDGTRVGAETSRRLACDCSAVKIHRGAEDQAQSRVLGAGRRKRTVSPQLRRALEARDRGCRFPGCGARFTEAHHVVHWQDGGETTLGNCLLLCRRHHRAVHEGGVTVCLDVNRQAVFFTPKGKALAGALPRRLPRPRRQGEGGFEAPAVTQWGGMPTYNRDRDIPWEEEARPGGQWIRRRCGVGSGLRGAPAIALDCALYGRSGPSKTPEPPPPPQNLLLFPLGP